ncbi:MAG: class I SAM-dependent methyltransferase [Gemmatimonadaceae bacterium]
MVFQNVYDDEERARAYADLEFPGTYYLAFRDIPQLLTKHVSGKCALDFGCGAGRSTRFLRDHGFDVIGVDISEAMLNEALRRDPQGCYHLLLQDGLSVLGDRSFDLVLSAFTFDNIPLRERRVNLFRELSQHLTPDGRIVNLVSSEQIYLNEWLSFSTRDFPENRSARPGDRVRITMLDVPDRRPVEDIVWTERDYAETFAAAGLDVLEVHRPLGNDQDPFRWVSETTIAPWTIHVLGRAAYT